MILMLVTLANKNLRTPHCCKPGSARPL